MPSIRSIAITGALTGAAVLTIPGFAGADDDTAKDTDTVEVAQREDPQTSPAERIDTALEGTARQADAEEPGDEGSELEATESSTQTETSQSEITQTEGSAHGECVSDVARSTPPGPDHGPTVSDAARDDCWDSSADSTEEPRASDEGAEDDRAPRPERGDANGSDDTETDETEAGDEETSESADEEQDSAEADETEDEDEEAPSPA